MGIDFEMAMAVFLKDGIEPEVFAAFRYMVGKYGDTKEEPPSNPFPEEFGMGNDKDGRLMRWFGSYEPSTNYPETVDGIPIRDTEGYMYDGGATEFPGEYGAILRRVYRYNLPAIQGNAPVYSWMLSFRVAGDMDVFGNYIDFANALAEYSATEGLVGYYRFEHDNTPTLLHCRNGELFAYEVDWDPAQLKSLR